jgi:hypothetical protein
MHAIQCGWHENLRSMVETRVGNIDPNRAKTEQDAHDTMLFANLIRGGPPDGQDINMEQYLWCVSRIMYAHISILRHFGRYPYDVMWSGEVYTEEEKEYLERTGWFHVTKLEEGELKQMKLDIRGGRWPPLIEEA